VVEVEEREGRQSGVKDVREIPSRERVEQTGTGALFRLSFEPVITPAFPSVSSSTMHSTRHEPGAG
jgi:hypothetical protein